MYDAVPSEDGKSFIVTNGVAILLDSDGKPRKFKSRSVARHEAKRLNGGEEVTDSTSVTEDSEGARFEVRYDAETPGLSQRWQVWDVAGAEDLLLGSFDTEFAASDAKVEHEVNWLGSEADREHPPTLRTYNYFVQEAAAQQIALADPTFVGDSMSQIIARADSRCQGSIIHRRMGVRATTTVEVYGVGKVKVCEQCQDFYNPFGKFCEYTLAHQVRAVPAKVVIDCGPVGIVPACKECAEFYIRMESK